jgi:DNA helicase HerA-like ATPase
MTIDRHTREAVLRVGEVCEVDGRRIYVLVDKNKNLSDMFLDGDIIRNISVNSYIEIRKGFLSIIGRVEGEKIVQERVAPENRESPNWAKRILTVALAGYIDARGSFVGGTRELPLLGNEAYLVTRTRMHVVHNLVRAGCPCINIATIFGEDFDVEFPIDGLFNSHIAIFGNTGSGKSNTLAALFQALTKTLSDRNDAAYRERTRFLLFDFNGEYSGTDCITQNKTVYNLSTRQATGDRLPIELSALLDVEVLSILAEATEKTQRPFLRRALWLLKRSTQEANDPISYIKGILKTRVRSVLQMSDKIRAYQIIDYLREVLPEQSDDEGEAIDLIADLEWHNTMQEFRVRASGVFLSSSPSGIDGTLIYQSIESFEWPEDLVAQVITFLYLQLTSDIIANRAQNEHIAPVINRLKAKRADIDKVFVHDAEEAGLWSSNFVVVNLDNVNLDMKKTLPLLIAKKTYAEHKQNSDGRTLSIIIDEAHNILSTQSFREAESWKDYRLETFEEIIKEGRKFGVFVTIASQRPSDISPTITSQAHNYFIHRLINERDLKTIASAVSYIDKVTEESIPTLPTGTCVFSGVASQVPLKINVKPLSASCRPQSSTREFAIIVPETEDTSWLETGEGEFGGGIE